MNKGFTLIEIIVSLAIFSVLVMIVGGVSVASLNLERKALNLKKVEENSRFVLELMSRELRVADPINTPDNVCPGSGGSFISFTHPVNGNIEYDLVNSQIVRRVNGVESAISNPDVEIASLLFCISGNLAGDRNQPKVSIVLRVRAGGLAGQATTFDLQTTVSERRVVD